MSQQQPQPPYSGGGSPQGPQGYPGAYRNPQQTYSQGQGGYPGQPSAPQAYGRSSQKAGARNGLAWTAIVIAIATVFISPIVNTALQATILHGGNGNFELFTVLQLVFNGVVPALLAAIGLVLGIIAARGSGKLVAGIAIGLNAMVIGSTIIGYGLQTIITPLLY